MDKVLSEAYKNPKHPASYGGVNALHRALKGRVKLKDIKSWLRTKESYTLHKPVKYKFKRNRVIVGGLNEQFQADLVDMQSLTKFNDGYKYILTCIDILSKYAWAIPLRDKKADSVVAAFRKIFLERKPDSLQTDAGKEFTNNLLQKFLRQEKVHFFMTNNDTKASIVERFNRTLKTKMWRYFTEKNTHKYIDLEEFVYSYNRTWHRSIKMDPVSVTIHNQSEVWKNLYGDQPIDNSVPRFKVGDTVRISKAKMRFEKGYEQNWTREIFTIDKIVLRNPVVYKLKDLTGEDITGSFYNDELQKIAESGYYPVEKILKKRKRNGKVEYFVKFQGYPEKFNTWVQEIKNI